MRPYHKEEMSKINRDNKDNKKELIKLIHFQMYLCDINSQRRYHLEAAVGTRSLVVCLVT